MERPETILDEIIIVGSRYGDLADVLTPLYERGEPIGKENVKQLLGSDEVLLAQIPNHHDHYAVGVYTLDQMFLGFVWMYQSPSVFRWLEDHEKEFVRAHVKRVISKSGLMLAKPDLPMKLVHQGRDCWGMDMDWANGIPAKLHSLTEQSISLGMALLMDDLETATQWSDHLQMRINNLLRDLPLDLSAHNCQKGLKLIEMMRDSSIPEVRQYCDDVLASFVSRGSMAQMTWWVEHWMPNFFRDIASDVLSIFEAANYTLERVEELLGRAPDNLFYLYKADRLRFAFHLYYLALPQPLYTRLLTLLAVREAMLNRQGGIGCEDGITKEMLARVIENCQGYFWGYSSYAVPYCVYRDDFKMMISHNDFEGLVRSLPYKKDVRKCPAGTISNAFSDNPIFNEHIDDWDKFDPMKRIIKLRDALRKEIKSCKSYMKVL